MDELRSILKRAFMNSRLANYTTAIGIGIFAAGCGDKGTDPVTVKGVNIGTPSPSIENLFENESSTHTVPVSTSMSDGSSEPVEQAYAIISGDTVGRGTNTTSLRFTIPDTLPVRDNYQGRIEGSTSGVKATPFPFSFDVLAIPDTIPPDTIPPDTLITGTTASLDSIPDSDAYNPVTITGTVSATRSVDGNPIAPTFADTTFIYVDGSPVDTLFNATSVSTTVDGPSNTPGLHPVILEAIAYEGEQRFISRDSVAYFSELDPTIDLSDDFSGLEDQTLRVHIPVQDGVLDSLTVTSGSSIVSNIVISGDSAFITPVTDANGDVTYRAHASNQFRGTATSDVAGSFAADRELRGGVLVDSKTGLPAEGQVGVYGIQGTITTPLDSLLTDVNGNYSAMDIDDGYTEYMVTAQLLSGTDTLGFRNHLFIQTQLDGSDIMLTEGSFPTSNLASLGITPAQFRDHICEITNNPVSGESVLLNPDYANLASTYIVADTLSGLGEITPIDFDTIRADLIEALVLSSGGTVNQQLAEQILRIGNSTDPDKPFDWFGSGFPINHDNNFIMFRDQTEVAPGRAYPAFNSQTGEVLGGGFVVRDSPFPDRAFWKGVTQHEYKHMEWIGHAATLRNISVMASTTAINLFVTDVDTEASYVSQGHQGGRDPGYILGGQKCNVVNGFNQPPGAPAAAPALQEGGLHGDVTPIDRARLSGMLSYNLPDVTSNIPVIGTSVYLIDQKIPVVGMKVPIINPQRELRQDVVEELYNRRDLAEDVVLNPETSLGIGNSGPAIEKALGGPQKGPELYEQPTRAKIASTTSPLQLPVPATFEESQVAHTATDRELREIAYIS